MEHAASPGLFSLGLTADTSSEGSSFRWGLASSIALHVLVIVMSMYLRFPSSSEQPLRTIGVTLISLPTMPMTAPRSKAAPPPAKKRLAASTPTVLPKVQPITPPVEDTLPPLPTQTASERLSEALGGAINSIIVPQKREAISPIIPSQDTQLSSAKDQAPLLDTIQLPSASPTISRPNRLERAESLKIPSMPTPPTATLPKKLETTAQPPSQSSPNSTLPTPHAQPFVKPAPTIPTFSKVTPFKRARQATTQSKPVRSSKIEEVFKKSLSNITTPVLRKPPPKLSRKQSLTQAEPTPFTPKVLAPPLATIPESVRNTPSKLPLAVPPPAVPKTALKMAETVKKLMEGLKSTTRRPTPKQASPQRTKPSTTSLPSTARPPSEIAQQIAKLSIPDVTPVESIEQRMQLLEVQARGNPGRSGAKQSPGKNRYLAMVEERIDQKWVALPLLEDTPLVVLKFRISQSGEIARLHISTSSGNSHYDSLAQRAVQSVNPLPSFPPDVSESFFDVQYRFIKD